MKNKNKSLIPNFPNLSTVLVEGQNTYFINSKTKSNMKRHLLVMLLLLLAGFSHSYAQCNLQFTWAPVSTSAYNNIEFTNTTPTVPTGPGYFWYMYLNYGDGDFDTWSTPDPLPTTVTHIYTSPGTYNLFTTLMIYDSLNMSMYCSDTFMTTVNVAIPSCLADMQTTNLGGGTYEFTATPYAPAASLTYSWDFGDGNTGSGSSVTHTYAASGIYTLVLTVSDGSGCTNSTTYLIYYNSSINCNSLTASFSNYVNGYSVSFINTTSPGHPELMTISTWDFGDGNSATGSTPNHFYASLGSYQVTLYNVWVDTGTHTPVCYDTVTQTINITDSYILGHIIYDTTLYSVQPAFKVWLIEHDTANATLIAVDSQVTIFPNNIYYYFTNPATATYLVKAAPVGGTLVTPGYGLVPTYQDTTIYWSQAIKFHFNSGNYYQSMIFMQKGTPATGPGFIGGNISAGANKGTSGGISGMIVFLRDIYTGKMVKATYTDGNGDYSFGNLPAGDYDVYPEDLGYFTTPSSTLHVLNGQTNFPNVNFIQTQDEIKPIITSVANIQGSDIISIYPNPAQEILTLQLSNKINSPVYISITDVSGRVLQASTHTPAGTYIQLDVSAISSGLYFVRIQSEGVQHTEKVMIQH